ncbi:MAG: RAD55 family ATPase [Candidatus Methanoperedens sp.]|nr:RAD55 family ATPase [Candidatus Methanoperedens sp.]
MSTAIPALDRNFGGGLPSGSLVYIRADVEAMAEVFLYQFTQARKTYYFANERKPKHIYNDIRNLGFDTSQIIFMDLHSEYHLTPGGDAVNNLGDELQDSKIVEYTEYSIKKIMEEQEEDINIVIDSFSFFLNLNINPGLLKRFIYTIYETTKNLNCLTFLYGIKGLNKGGMETEILNSSDVIFDIELKKSGQIINKYLSIPKIRRKHPMNEMIKFKIENGIKIDTSQDIA